MLIVFIIPIITFKISNVFTVITIIQSVIIEIIRSL